MRRASEQKSKKMIIFAATLINISYGYSNKENARWGTGFQKTPQGKQCLR
jgi:hypothetical protein